MKTVTIWVNGRFLNRKVSGVERVAIEMLNNLAENFLSPEGVYSTSAIEFQFKWALEPGTTHSVPQATKGWETRTIGKRQGHAWEQIDLAQFAPSDWLLNLCNTAPLFRKKQIVFFHDAQVYAIPQNFDWKFKWWYRALFNIAGRRSKVILTNSYFSRKELHHYTHIDLEKIKVIHLGSDHINRISAQLPDEIRLKTHQQPFVLAVSSASPNKNFAAVLQALNHLGDKAPYCVIVGQQYAQVFKTSEHQQIQSDKLIQVGYVSDEVLAGLYQNALCLIYPSFYEGFGLPPLEAMQLSCPVIASNTSSIPEVCGEAVVYCDPHNSKTIAKGIEKLMNQASFVSTLKKQSLEHAQQFNWSKSARRLLHILEEQIQN